MFDQTFVSPDAPARKARTFTLSIALQCTAVCIVILTSIVQTQRLRTVDFKVRLLAPPPPVPIKQIPVATAATTQPSAPSFHSNRYPFLINVRPHATATKASTSEPAPAINWHANSTSDVMGVATLLDKPVQAPPPAPPVKPVSAARTGPTRISAGVAEANLVAKVLPRYPQLAVIAHVEGAVHFRAVIGTSGRIENIELISGHPLLVASAREAVLQWRYRPTTLNGQAVSVVTDITVNFHLGER